MVDPADEDGGPIYVNGVHGATGEYLLPPIEPSALAQAITGVSAPADTRKLELNRGKRDSDGVQKTIAGIDDADIAQAGWGLVFSGRAEDAERVAAIRDALAPLRAHRQQQAGSLKPGRYREYTGKDGYRGESALVWAERNGVDLTQSVDPDGMPFYLLVVGDPGQVPFEFQYDLDVQRAIGRLHFDDLDGYRAYAENVVAVETLKHKVRPRLALFGPRHAGDGATALSATRLIPPLGDRLKTEPGWNVEVIAPAEATKAQLKMLVDGRDAPGLLLTACHGIAFDMDDPLQATTQGALICQDWAGPGKVPSRDAYLASADLTDTGALRGRMAFFFACYGAGTPKHDDFAYRVVPDAPRQLAAAPFLSTLPMRLLAGGMLAVMGHVDRAWSHSFNWRRAGSQVQVFESVLRQVMNGRPVGAAFDDFNVRNGALAQLLGPMRDRAARQDEAAYGELSRIWTATTDARNYVILGDPATRIAV